MTAPHLTTQTYKSSGSLIEHCGTPYKCLFLLWLKYICLNWDNKVVTWIKTSWGFSLRPRLMSDPFKYIGINRAGRGNFLLSNTTHLSFKQSDLKTNPPNNINFAQGFKLLMSGSGLLLCPVRWELWETPVETAGIRACWMAISHIRATSCPTPLTWRRTTNRSVYQTDVWSTFPQVHFTLICCRN